MKKTSTYLQIFIISILLLGCSKTDPVSMPLIEKTTEVEQLFEHSKEFTQKIYSYENGIHAAVGYGIANSYLIEGDGSNIIIDATDSVFQAEKVRRYNLVAAEKFLIHIEDAVSLPNLGEFGNKCPYLICLNRCCETDQEVVK